MTIVNDASAEVADLGGFAVAEQHVGNAAAQRELVVQLAVRVEDVVLVTVEHDAAVRQFAEGVEVMMPFAFGVEQRLMAVLPELLDDGLEGRPIMGGESLWVDKRHATPVHPEADRHLLGRIGGGQTDVAQMGHQSFAGLEDFVRLRLHVHRQANEATQLVG